MTETIIRITERLPDMESLMTGAKFEAMVLSNGNWKTVTIARPTRQDYTTEYPLRASNREQLEAMLDVYLTKPNLLFVDREHNMIRYVYT